MKQTSLQLRMALSTILLCVTLSAGAPAIAQTPVSPVVANAKYYTYATRAGDYTVLGDPGAKTYIKWLKTNIKNGTPTIKDSSLAILICDLDGRLGENGKVTHPDYAQALEWSKKAMDEIDAVRKKYEASNGPSHEGPFSLDHRYDFLGYRYLGQGEPPVQPNAEMALAWLTLAAKNVEVFPLAEPFTLDDLPLSYGVDAEYNLGLAYLKGDVLPQDTAKGLSWLTAAAANQDAHATVLLGLLCKEGIVVPKDDDASQKLFELAPRFFAIEEAEQRNDAKMHAGFEAQTRQLFAQLDAIHAQGRQDMFNAAIGGFSSAFPEVATAAPLAIQSATAQQLANLDSKEQSIEAERRLNQTIARLKQTQASPQRPQIAQQTSFTPRPQVAQASPQPPIQQAGSAQGMQVCPASGFVPGPGHYAACDAYVGERLYCSPGQSIPIQTPAPPPASCGATASTSNTNAGGSASPTDGPPEAACIQLSSDPTNIYPVFHNTCSFAVKYFWTPFKTPAGGYAEQNGILQPGETQTGAEAAVGGYRVYACQINYLVVGPDGSPITGVVNGFRCVKP